MIVPAYTPGDWYAVVTDGSVVLLPGTTSAEIVRDIWISLRGGGALTEQLQVLLAPGIAQLPPFALVSVEGGEVHAVVRGEVEVEVVTSSGTRVLSAAQVATWTEELIAAARSLTVRVPATGAAAGTASAPQDGTELFPVLSGVVRASSVEVELRESRGRRGDRPGAAGAAEGERAVEGRRRQERGPAEAPAPVMRGDQPASQEQVTPEEAPAREAVPEPVGSLASVPFAAAATPAARLTHRGEALTPRDLLEVDHLAGQPDDRAADARETAPSEAGEPASPAEPAGTAEPAAPTAAAVTSLPAAAVAPEDSTGISFGAPVASSADAGPASVELADDHDGLTVLSSDVVALRRQLPEWAGDAVPGPFAVPAPQAPPPAKIQLSSGLVVSLNRPVLLGRAPQVSRVTNSQLPRLVTVASPNQDISRTHAEVRMDGEDVLVTDLRSTNGVLLLRQNAGPQRLHPGEPTAVEPGVVVDLGEGVTFIVERGT